MEYCAYGCIRKNAIQSLVAQLQYTFPDVNISLYAGVAATLPIPAIIDDHHNDYAITIEGSNIYKIEIMQKKNVFGVDVYVKNYFENELKIVQVVY